MSWDIVIFNSRQKIENAEEIDDSQFEPTDFNAAFVRHFDNIKKNGDKREIVGEDFSIVYYTDNELGSNTLLNLYGEKGLYEIVLLAKKHNWQIYDTGIGQMLDLDNPANNGYENFQKYLDHILRR